MKAVSDCSMLEIGIWRYQEKPELSPLVQQRILKGSKLNCQVALSLQLLGIVFI